jgi:hypothetical protein
MTIRRKTGYITEQYFKDSQLYVVFRGLLPIKKILWVSDDVDVSVILGNELLVNYVYDDQTMELLKFDRDFGEYP